MTAGLPDDQLAERRRLMVETQIRGRGIADARVLDAMAAVPRHRFIRPQDVDLAYGDYPVDIGLGQTISQPYIVGFMSEALALKPTDRVLEIGTGSGYQTAVLAELAAYQPKQWIPPPNEECDQFQPPYPMIATPHMR